MSLFMEMLTLLLGAGLLGIALGWLLHGSCQNEIYHDSVEEEA